MAVYKCTERKTGNTNSQCVQFVPCIASVDEIQKWLLSYDINPTFVKFDEELRLWFLSFYDRYGIERNEILVAQNEYLVRDAGWHFKAMSKKDFFEEYYIYDGRRPQDSEDNNL